MNTFSLIFLAALALATVTKLWLSARHIAYVQLHRERVPAAFAGDISLDAHRKAADYSAAKTRVDVVGTLIETAVILALTFGGGLQLLHELTANWVTPGVARGVALIMSLALLMAIIDLPLARYLYV